MIYAVDFDGTLCSYMWPGIGEPNTELIDRLISEKQNGAELILWTMREGEALREALEWCSMHGLEFDAVNDNLERLQREYGNNPRKVYGDIYIDDHNGFLEDGATMKRHKHKPRPVCEWVKGTEVHSGDDAGISNQLERKEADDSASGEFRGHQREGDANARKALA